MTTTAAQQASYSTGYTNAQAVQAILEGQVRDGIITEQTLTECAVRCILPVDAIDPTWEQIGSSEAWSEWQTARRQTARRAAQAHHFAGQR